MHGKTHDAPDWVAVAIDLFAAVVVEVVVVIVAETAAAVVVVVVVAPHDVEG